MKSIYDVHIMVFELDGIVSCEITYDDGSIDLYEDEELDNILKYIRDVEKRSLI